MTNLSRASTRRRSGRDVGDHPSPGASRPPSAKRCPHCDEVKPAGDFSPSKQTGDGLAGWCRECMRDAVRQSRARHGRTAAQNAREWREQHPDRVAAYNAARRAGGPANHENERADARSPLAARKSGEAA